MDHAKISISTGVTLAGGGDLDARMLGDALQIAPELIAADGAADRLAGLGHIPLAIVGDMDSIRNLESWRGSATKIVQFDEQDTTDFEKCLLAINAPYYIGVGFMGGRTDHMLAALHALLRHSDKPIVLVGPDDVIALISQKRPFSVVLHAGERVSLFPLEEVLISHSYGLRWPVSGMRMRIGQKIGTSNIASGGALGLTVDGPGLIISLERSRLGDLVTALTA